MQVRLLPSEMLPFNDDTPRRGVLSGNTVKMGIEFDAKGRRVAYHFLTRHPGDFSTFDASTAITERVPAERVAHMFRPLRPGQLRGIPHTLSSLITLAMIDLYDDAELERKRTTALFAGFVTSPAQEARDESEVSATIFGNSLDAYTDQVALEPGVMAQLAPGEQVQFAEPSDVGSNYEAFQYRNLLRAAAGMGVPYYSMTGDPNKANYSALRAGLVEFKRRIVPMQHGVLIQQFCRRVWHRWMDAAAFVGALPWPRSTWLTSRRVLSRHKWIPPHWDYVDPQKDAAAEILLINNLLKSRSDSIEEQGFDPEEVDERIALDNEREAALGLVRRSQPGTPATPANENAPRGSGSEGGGAGETEEQEEAADAQE
jgi:lambda family phage portal protein